MARPFERLRVIASHRSPPADFRSPKVPSWVAPDGAVATGLILGPNLRFGTCTCDSGRTYKNRCFFADSGIPRSVQETEQASCVWLLGKYL